jgi:hypothetical protein
MRVTRLLAALMVALLTMGSLCEKPPARQWEPGFFEPIPGKTWNWPTGLDVIHMWGAFDPIPASDLPLELLVRNNSTKRVEVRMPAGLVFSPNISDYQYMMLLQEFTFSCPEGDTTVNLPTYCANEDLDEPDDESLYEVALQVWELELNDLFDVVEPKLLVDDAMILAQDALWEITEGGSLSDSTRQKLLALRDR